MAEIVVLAVSALLLIVSVLSIVRTRTIRKDIRALKLSRLTAAQSLAEETQAYITRQIRAAQAQIESEDEDEVMVACQTFEIVGSPRHLKILDRVARRFRGNSSVVRQVTTAQCRIKHRHERQLSEEVAVAR
ncbi:MAG: hypothetical protein OEV49_04770 [candidate division Zixibacteria bacterium]|nr:hypothetical protein [candidate division Zixibacteria bacterium]MDH3938475.1 hypothetical protein [candidate division Zixibacteria bacterium]MDH4032421.1 hypothetical protein [candidate division Zixibacteria bacterium]